MFNLVYKIPKDQKVNIAFSGGVDSLALAVLYKRMRYNVELLHFNHGCEYSDAIEDGCRNLACELDLPISVGYNDVERDPKKSIEDQWRRARYRFLYGRVENNGFVCTAHHLNDSVETWIWSSLHGNGKIIEPLQNIDFDGKVIKLVRPLLMVEKDKLIEYVEAHKYECVEDAYNKDLSLTRNYIRNIMMEHVKVVNPGIEKVIRKKYLKKMKESS